MTMPYERKGAVNRAHDLLVDILWNKYEEAPRGGELWTEASRALKHFPSDFYMDEAQQLAPEVFGEWRQDEKLTRIEIIGEDGREVVQYAPEGCYYRRSVQDDGQTVKFFVEKKSG